MTEQQITEQKMSELKLSEQKDISPKTIFNHIIEILSEMEKRMDCKICDDIKTCVHCIVCNTNNCIDHSIGNLLKLNKCKFSNNYCTFVVNVEHQQYALVPSRIGGNVLIMALDKSKKNYGYDNYVCVSVKNHHNLDKVIECVHNKLNLSVYTDDGETFKPFDEVYSGISKHSDTSINHDYVNGDFKIYLKRNKYSTINFICGDTKCLINIDTIFNNFKDMDEDVKKFIKTFKVNGLVLPNKITFRRDAKNILRTKISWFVKLVAEFPNPKKENVDEEQSNYEDEISPSVYINKLNDLVKKDLKEKSDNNK
ncbi:hypothetical protein AMV140 [Betaentomopoxvirus amoorei]|uniref:AMV140 n=1 Tax=Amsacta moorei entomopoxvirus TaxID=28321 RepID=Q9EMQ9_AMEPV|nr:hypothetical protein AMV140 [Amsacta moorei entomopoxvirus]AAG02846.1 AMV140 [Amsacta moorei entomopoxvirus]